jgi:hypothetical protein
MSAAYRPGGQWRAVREVESNGEGAESQADRQHLIVTAEPQLSSLRRNLIPTVFSICDPPGLANRVYRHANSRTSSR